MHKFSLPAKIFTILLFAFLVVGAYFIWPRGTEKQVLGAEVKEDPNHPVEVYYGAYEFKTLDAMVRDLSIQVYPEDKVDVFPPPQMGIGSRITITRATPVILTDAKITKTYRTWKNTVQELIAENKIDLIGKDSSEPTPETVLNYNMKVKITRVAEVELTVEEDIDYKTIKKNDYSLETGQVKTEQKGEKGTKEVIYLIKRVDGEEVSRSVISTKVLDEAVNEILIIGTGPKLVHSGTFADLLNAAAKQYDVNATSLQCLMLRESGGTPETGYPDAYYKGLFQYEDGYWADASVRSGFGGASIYDAKAQIFTTAHEIANGQSRRWPPFAHCANL